MEGQQRLESLEHVERRGMGRYPVDVDVNFDASVLHHGRVCRLGYHADEVPWTQSSG